MSRTLKKRFAAIIMAFLLVFMAMATVCGLKTDKADALSIDYADHYGYQEVYYFSDSRPAFNEYFNDAFFDIHSYISVEEFEFMVYGGYFMGFDYDYTRAVVIIQLATIKPSEQTLNDLFYCLHYQNCKVMFLTPFMSEYGNLECDFTLLCYLDNYDLFLRNSVAVMCGGYESVKYSTEQNSILAQVDNNANIYSTYGSSNTEPQPLPEPPSQPEPSEPSHSRPNGDGNSVPDNTILFLDRQLCNYAYYMDIRQCYMYSRAFRRLLGYMRDYGYDNYEYNDCERAIYDDLWGAYAHLPFFEEYGITPNCYNIYETIETWNRLWEYGLTQSLYDFWYAYNSYDLNMQYEEYYAEFYNSYLQAIGEYYYSDYVDYFNERNIHVFAHAQGTTYYSLFEINSSDAYECTEYVFDTYNEFLGFAFNISPTDYIYAIAINITDSYIGRLDEDYYTLLITLQNYIDDNKNEEAVKDYEIYSQGVTIFFWGDFIWDPNGLRLDTAQGLKDYFGQENGYDYDYWFMMFLEYLNELLNQLWYN
ncbi:MAG: hypothetical protein K2F90_04615 [Clostridiales bacterium]|nr:hypothetical protein [Clostridiales bacterium]